MSEHYADFESYLQKISYLGIKPGLERITAALEKLGSPHKELRVIHIAGTNGKGSVCHLLTQLLATSGFSVGLNISPHIVNYRERIQIYDHDRASPPLNVRGGSGRGYGVSCFPRSISETELLETHSCIQKSLKGDFGLTFFEYTTLLALVFFARQKVDFVVLETGMGGRWDATNVCNSVLSGITMIGFDHMAVLGDTLPKILAEKLQIIKKGSCFLCGIDQPELVEQAKFFCAAQEAGYHHVSEFYRQLGDVFDVASQNLDRPEGFRNNLFFTLALGQILTSLGFNLDLKKFAALPHKYFPPARYEILHDTPPVIVDGAHNEPGLKMLAKYFRQTQGRSYDLFFGCLADRDAEDLAALIVPAQGDIFWMIFDGGPRSPDVAHYARSQKNFGGKILSVDSTLKEKLSDGTRPKLICGSLYLCAEVRKLFTPECQTGSQYPIVTAF